MYRGLSGIVTFRLIDEDTGKSAPHIKFWAGVYPFPARSALTGPFVGWTDSPYLSPNLPFLYPNHIMWYSDERGLAELS